MPTTSPASVTDVERSASRASRREDLEVVRVEGVRAIALDHEHTDQAPVDHQRDVHLRTLVPGRQVTGVAPDLRRVMQPAIQEGTLAQTFAGTDAQPGGGVGPTRARHQYAVPGGLIYEQQRDEIVLEGFIVKSAGHGAADIRFAFGQGDGGAEPHEGRAAIACAGGAGCLPGRLRQCPFRHRCPPWERLERICPRGNAR